MDIKKKSRAYLEENIGDDETKVGKWAQGGANAGVLTGIVKSELNPKKSMIEFINAQKNPGAMYSALFDSAKNGGKLQKLLARAAPTISKASNYGLAGAGVGLAAGLIKKSFDNKEKISAQKKIREYMQ